MEVVKTMIIIKKYYQYYKSNKERLQARVKYGELANEEKNMKRKYGRNSYRKIPEEDNIILTILRIKSVFYNFKYSTDIN